MMDDTHEMTAEDEPLGLHPQQKPAEADPATAALTAARPAEDAEEEDAAGTPVDEQEDPYAERLLPGFSDEEAEPEEEAPAEEEPEETTTEEAAAPVVEAAPAPAAPAPAAPEKEEAPVAARQRYWQRVLTGSAATVPDEVRERAGLLQEAGLSEEQREYRLLSAINRSWAADHMELPREQVRADWSRLREKLARRYRVADDERELFAALSVEAQDAPLRERLQSLCEEQYLAALRGEAFRPDAVAVDEQLPLARSFAEAAHQRGEAQRREHLELAQQVAEGLNAFAGVEEELVPAFRVLGSMPGFARAVEALAEMDEPTRHIVYTIARAEYASAHPEGDASLYRTARRAMARGATSMGYGVGQALAHASAATMSSLGSALGEEWGRGLREGASALDARARIVEEIRRLHHDELRPLLASEHTGFAGQLLVDAASGTPTALAACCGGAGFATLGLSGVGEAVAAARRRAPEGSQWLQYLAGVVGGTIQAGIYSGMSRVGGKMLENALGSFARASGKGAGGYALSALGSLGAMGFEQGKLLFAAKAADAVGLGAQELAARLEKTASNIDWREYGDNAADLELNLREAAMTLPFILIASGRVALRHFRSRHAVLGEGHALQQWGIDEATRDAIMKEPDVNRQGDMLREALRGSRRWSAPGFLAEAMRALRLLNTDYYQGFRDKQEVVDFLQLPSQSSRVPRPPFVASSAENPEHVRQLQQRHGSGEKVNRSRLPIALQIYDEWVQKAHLVPEPASPAPEGQVALLPTSARRRHYGLELLDTASLVPPRMRPGGHYAPRAEAECMAMLRDRVAEIHDLSYQMLLASFPLDALSHSSRSVDHLRADGEKARTSMLEAVGRSVIRRATGVPEGEALDELGQHISQYFKRRRYSSFPPGWMKRVPSLYTLKLDEQARATFREELSGMPPEMRDACRVTLGLRACASALYELMPALPDFRTALARGLSPAEAYVHLLNRELGVDVTRARGVEEMLAPYGPRATNMGAYRRRNEAAFEIYRRLTGCEPESARGANGKELWRVRRPNGSYTHWHPRRGDAINDLVANSSFTFMPFWYDRTGPLRQLESAQSYDLSSTGLSEPWHFSGYDHLCRVALRDTARSWVESTAYAQPGFEMTDLRQYVYLGGRHPQYGVLAKEGGAAAPDTMQVDTSSLTSPLRLAQARFRTYWWRELSSGLLSVDTAGEELVKMRIISAEELARVKEIGKAPLMPRGKDVPLRDTPPPDIAGMQRALVEHLTDFSTRYMLSHLDVAPLPPSAREWFRLAPLCPLEPETLPERAFRISKTEDSTLYTSLQNRVAARELREAAPAVEDLRRAEREGLLMNSALVAGYRDAVGLNRIRNLEQAWCAQFCGAEAMMSSSQPFWRVLEKPMDNLPLLPGEELRALQEGVEQICRLEPAPEVQEVSSRGETPNHLQLGLLNLQEVLAEHPQLHQYGNLSIQNGLAVARHLVPIEPGQGTAPFAEPEYKLAPLYTGGRMQPGYTLSEPEPLPDFAQQDARVLPALYLLDALRGLPVNRPHARHEGIAWKGELYGGSYGKAPRGIDDNWHAETPLEDLIYMLDTVELLRLTSEDGRVPELFGMELPGLGEKLNMRPLHNITLYRNRHNLSNLCRLMPGEPESGNPAARSPYVIQSIAGSTLCRGDLLEAHDMHRAYMPLEQFRRPYRTRIALEKHAKHFREASLQYSVASVLSPAMGRSAQRQPRSGPASLRELLMRFAEDSGFSRSLYEVDPRSLSYGQLLALRLSREMLLSVCGQYPEAAYQRLLKLGQDIRQDPDAGEAVMRALFSASEQLMTGGVALFRDHKPRKKKEEEEKKKRPRPVDLRIPSAEKENLEIWRKQHEADPDYSWQLIDTDE